MLITVRIDETAPEEIHELFAEPIEFCSMYKLQLVNNPWHIINATRTLAMCTLLQDNLRMGTAVLEYWKLHKVLVLIAVIVV